MQSKLIYKNDSDSGEIISNYLLENKICIIPCDTIYGIIGVAPFTKNSIIHAKGRNERKPFIQLADLDIADSLFKNDIPEQLKQYWPGPLTIISESTDGGTIAVRVPEDKFLNLILHSVGKPLYSTSVNYSGQKSVNEINEIIQLFKNRVDLICDGGEIKNPAASTILDITVTPYKILRQGDCKISELSLQ